VIAVGSGARGGSTWSPPSSPAGGSSYDEYSSLPAFSPHAVAKSSPGKDSFTRLGYNHAMHGQMDDETGLATVRACLEQFSRTLGIARSLVRAGKTVDLTGLDAEMGYVCARTLDLPPEDGRALRPKLIGLRAELDALSVALATRPPPG
jgi:hypothetical protein